MLLPDQTVARALGLSPSTLRTRRARGRLQHRGSTARPTERLGQRQHALVSVQEAAAFGQPRYGVRCGTGLVWLQDPRGRIRRATLAEREAYAIEKTGSAERCPCERCLAERAADELARRQGESVRETWSRFEDEDGPQRRERTL